MKKLALMAVVLATPLAAQSSDPASQVSADSLHSYVQKLVSFGTRHTLSTQTDPKRGIGAAVDWGAETFRAMSRKCGGCLEVVLPEKMVQGPRIPNPVRLRDVVAIQRGTERPKDVVIIQGHIDSRVSDVMNATSDAPGANDDASGTAVALEAARVMSQHKYPVTIVYALLSGEEQGLYGGKLLAEYARQQGWNVKAVLNNDIVGNTCGSDGFCDADHVRVFSEGPRDDLTPALRAAQRRDGGENDSPSRNLSRFIARIADAQPSGLKVRQIWRADRMGRGGDQLPFEALGYPAVRFTVAVENYNHQHQDLRTEKGIEYGDTIDKMDFGYLAKVARLNVETAERLASTPMPPVPVAEAAVSTDTLIHWKPVPGAVSYAIWQRRTDAPNWPDKPVRANVTATSVKLEHVRGDDWFFGVSSTGANGESSPIASAVPAGQFGPNPPKDDSQ